MPERRMPTIALRLGLAFVAVLGLFAAALIVMLATLDRLAQADEEVAELDHAKHAGHVAAAQVREQYIHELHAILNWDLSHLMHYDLVIGRTRRSTETLRGLARSPQEKRMADEIARLAQDNDLDFRQAIVPAIERGDRAAVKKAQIKTEALVRRVALLNDDLNVSFERQSASARSSAARMRARARVATVVCFGLAIAIAAALGFLLMRSILRPIAAMRRGALRIADGDLGARIEVRGRGELAELATTFNRMAGDLTRHQEEAVRAQKLAYVGQVAAGVAHEINNPLGVILGYTKLLRRDGDREELRIIQDEAVQCQAIVQGLLDLARPTRLDRAQVDLCELARDAVERLRESGRLEGIEVTVSAAGAATAWADEAKLRQVVTNVLLNAAEATPPGGAVTLSASEREGEAVLCVQDSGPGIPGDVVPRIFDPFFTTKPSGTGLGLSVSQAIMDAHGGRIEIEPAQGRGTRVVLRVPRAPASLRTA